MELGATDGDSEQMLDWMNVVGAQARSGPGVHRESRSGPQLHLPLRVSRRQQIRPLSLGCRSNCRSKTNTFPSPTLSAPLLSTVSFHSTTIPFTTFLPARSEKMFRVAAATRLSRTPAFILLQ